VVIGIFVYKSGPDQKAPSPSLVCVVVLTCVYFMSHLFVYIANSHSVFKMRVRKLAAPSGLRGPAVAAASVVRPAPILAVMFLQCRLRAMQLDPWAGRPQLWAQCLFCICTAVVVLKVLVAAYEGYCGTMDEGYYNWPEFRTYFGIHALQHFLAFAIVGLIIGIIVSVNVLEPRNGMPKPVYPPTLKCVQALTVLYFVVYVLLHVSQSLNRLFEYSMPKLRSAAEAANVSVSFTPMIGILLLMVRMRALQVTNQQGGPQAWAQLTMYVCLFATFLQAACCLLLPVFLHKSTEVDDQGNAKFDLKPMIGAYCVTCVKYVVLTCLVGGIILLCISAYRISPKSSNYQGSVGRSATSFIKMFVVVLSIFLGALLLSSAKVVGLAIKFGIESADRAILGVDIHVGNAVLSVGHLCQRH